MVSVSAASLACSRVGVKTPSTWPIRPSARGAFSGGKISFEELVRRYAGDVPPRALLEELLRVRAAFETDDGYVRLLNRTYLPAPLDPVGLERLGNVVNYFIDTVDFNLQKKMQGAGRFERYAMTVEGLSPEAFKRFDELIREKGQELLEKLTTGLAITRRRAVRAYPTMNQSRLALEFFTSLKSRQSRQTTIQKIVTTRSAR